MKKIQRISSLLLVLSLLLGGLALPAAAFPDIRDPILAEQAEVLRALGIVSGTGAGLFNPTGHLDRASFCKMILTALDRGGEAALQSGRVIFNDVTARHWALGYVNAAASASEGGAPLVRGTGTGLFEPDAPITSGSAIAILMRALGYSDADVAMPGNWYDGYLARAKAIGLTDGLTLNGEDVLTRIEAAALFYNLLLVSPKGTSVPFLTTALGGRVTDETILLRLEEKVVRTIGGTYPITRAALPGSVVGLPVRLLLDRDGHVLSALVSEDSSALTVRILESEARYIVTDGGSRVAVSPATRVLRGGEEESTYGKLYLDLPAGTTAIFVYDKTDELSYLYLPDSGQNLVTMVAKSSSADFSALIGQSTAGLAVFKNGAPAVLSDAAQYDVGTYSRETATLYLSDRRVTGFYENLYPSQASPETVTVMGAKFEVLDCALGDLTGFRLGDTVTLLLDGENRVAGAVRPDAASADSIGLARIEGSHAQVDLTWGVTVQGSVSLSEDTIRYLAGKLVRVTAEKSGELTLRAVSGGDAAGAWNVAAGTVGTRRLSSSAAIYERVETSPLYRITPALVTAPSFPAESILYTGLNAKGEIDLLIIERATGDFFTYGFGEVFTTTSSSGDMVTTNSGLTVTNGGSSVSLLTGGTAAALVGKPMGIVPSVRLRAGETMAAVTIELIARTGIHRSAFRDGAVTVDGVSYPLDERIDDLCYNAVAREWFPSLADARAYSSTLTVYYDRAPEQGGKVRMVVAE